MNDNVEQALEIGIGSIMCIIAISLFFLFQRLMDVNYELFLQKMGG